MPGLTVSLIDGVRLDCRRAGLERFDALIVDEGQGPVRNALYRDPG